MEQQELKGQYCTLVATYAKIYTLSDSLGNVFYVGCTIHNIRQRVSQHLSEAKAGKLLNKKNLKIRSLDFKIVATIIDMKYVTGNKMKNMRRHTSTWEREWILKYRALGYDLTNRHPIVIGSRQQKQYEPEHVGQSFSVSIEKIEEIKMKDLDVKDNKIKQPFA